MITADTITDEQIKSISLAGEVDLDTAWRYPIGSTRPLRRDPQRSQGGLVITILATFGMLIAIALPTLAMLEIALRGGDPEAPTKPPRATTRRSK